MNQPLCPWCGGLTSLNKKLCHGCHERAVGVTDLTPEEVDSLPYGVIKLDTEGTILAFNAAEAERSACLARDVVGRNFFRDIAPCAAVKEYEGRFRELVNSDKPSAEFSFVYPFPQGAARVHIVMARAHESWIFIVSKEAVA